MRIEIPTIQMIEKLVDKKLRLIKSAHNRLLGRVMDLEEENKKLRFGK